MKPLILAAFAALLPLPAAAFGPLLSPAELAGSDDRPLILDIRGDEYHRGHVPGAVSAPYALFRGPADNPGAVVPEDQLEATLRQLGVTMDRPVVIVHQGSDQSDFGAAARVYWTLKSSGVSELAILNGGVNAWAAAGEPLDREPVAPTASDIDITFSDRWLADEDEVEAISAGAQQGLLLDSRPPAFFEGDQMHDAADRPGTVPGAMNVPHSEWFAGESPAMSTPAGATDIARKLGLEVDEPVVAFCNTGHWAATEWFALSELAGLPDVKLYPESMVGYSQDGRAMENTPGLLDNLLRQLRVQG